MPTKRNPTGRTKARQFRLGGDTLSRLDWLAARLGLSSRAEAIRYATSRTADAEGYPDASRKKQKKS